MRIFFDVHGTLLSTDERTLRPGAAKLLRFLFDAGHEVTLWSTAGSGYAWAFAHRFGLLPWTFETLSKRDSVAVPDVCVDDDEAYLIGTRGNLKVSSYRGKPEDEDLSALRELLRRIDAASPEG